MTARTLRTQQAKGTQQATKTAPSSPEACGTYLCTCTPLAQPVGRLKRHLTDAIGMKIGRKRRISPIGNFPEEGIFKMPQAIPRTDFLKTKISLGQN